MSSTKDKDIVYDLRLPPGLENSSLPVVEGVRQAGEKGDVNAVVSGLEAAINVANQLGIELYPGDGLSGFVPPIKLT